MAGELARSARVEGVLLAWNPLLEPETIRIHVEAHRASPARTTWWGRLSRGRSLKYSIRPAEEASALLSTETVRRPVLVTDYVRLHALKVDLVTKAQPDTPVPGYYARTDAKVSFWLRVVDIRALSHDQYETLDFLKTFARTGGPDSEYSVDPYASFTHLFPRRIFAPSTDVLFDPAGAPRSGFYADARGAIDRPVAEEAYKRLAAAWGKATWGQVSPFARECLAHADALYRDERLGICKRSDVDPAPVLLQLVRAVEHELVTELLAPLQAAAARPQASAKNRELAAALKGLTGELTLGSFTHALKGGGLRGWMARHAGDGPAERLFGEREWNRWLHRLVGQRNATLHPRRAATAASVREVASALLDPENGRPARALETIAGAKLQVQAALGLTS